MFQVLQTKQGISYCQYGPNKPKLVFVHGIFGSGRNWQSHLRYIYDKFSVSVAALDQRGQGQSPHFEGVGSIQCLADDLAFFLQEVATSPVDLVGHSLGGKVAMRMCSQHTSLVSKLMIVDTGLDPIASSLTLPIVEAMISLPTPVAERHIARKHLEQHISDRRIRDFLMTNLIAKVEGEYSWRVDLRGLKELVLDLGRAQLQQDWQKIVCPIFLIRGGISDHLSTTQVDEMLKLQPKTRFIEIVGAGHWCHADRPDDFQKALDEFIHQKIHS